MRIALLCLLALGACSKKPVDLSRGGVVLVYRLDSPTASVEEARRVVVSRLESLQVRAAVEVDGRRLRVLLPEPDSDTLASVRELLAAQARLQFREVDDGAWLEALEGTLPAGVAVKARPGSDGTAGRTLLVRPGAAPPAPPRGVDWVRSAPGRDGATELTPVRGAGLDPSAIKDAEAAEGQYGWEVRLTFTAAGAEAFAELTARLVHRHLGIVLDGKLLSAPVVQEPIKGGHALVTLGHFGSPEAQRREAKTLAVALRAGALPAPLILEEERAVAPAR